jgi:hypothetical protein
VKLVALHFNEGYRVLKVEGFIAASTPHWWAASRGELYASASDDPLHCSSAIAGPVPKPKNPKKPKKLLSRNLYSPGRHSIPKGDLHVVKNWPSIVAAIALLTALGAFAYDLWPKAIAAEDEIKQPRPATSGHVIQFDL